MNVCGVQYKVTLTWRRGYIPCSTRSLYLRQSDIPFTLDKTSDNVRHSTRKSDGSISRDSEAMSIVFAQLIKKRCNKFSEISTDWFRDRTAHKFLHSVGIKSLGPA
jgi:hypothetical protein